jgi:hypothetical protein
MIKFLFYIFLFPFILVHELTHYFMCKIIGYKVVGFEINYRVFKLNFIHDNDKFKLFLVGFSPFLFIFPLYLFLFMFYYSIWVNLLLLCCFPSVKDIKLFL